MKPEVTLKQEVYKSGLIDLYIEFWSNLSSRPLSEIQIACDERDFVKLLELANYNDEQILEFYDKVYLYSPQIVKDSLNVSTCNCDKEINFQNIVNFIDEIQKNGGADVFFNDLELRAPGTDWNKVAQCLAACSLTCLPMGWNPPAWAACYAAFTALCYYVPY